MSKNNAKIIESGRVRIRKPEKIREEIDYVLYVWRPEERHWRWIGTFGILKESKAHLRKYYPDELYHIARIELPSIDLTPKE